MAAKRNTPDSVGEGLKPSPTAVDAPAAVGTAETSPFPRRKPTRLPGYDYATPGAYFITTCADGFRCLFGRIEDGMWRPNRLGEIVEECWLQLRTHYPAIDLDEFAVMPNHFHGVVHLQDGAPSLVELVRGFKTFSARRINTVRHSPHTRVWQRSFHDRIVRSDTDLSGLICYLSIRSVPFETLPYSGWRSCGGWGRLMPSFRSTSLHFLTLPDIPPPAAGGRHAL